LTGNEGALGGAIALVGGDALVENTLLSGNSTAAGSSGAIWVGLDGQITATHVTLADNAGGAALHVAGTASAWVYSSIAWGNKDGFSGTYVDTDCNIDQSGVAGPATDPEFFAPASGDYHLRATSPAVDACTTGLPTDLENVARPVGSGYDMGAYEGGPYTHVYTPLVLKDS
jgi:hypothetical protein